MTPIVKVLPTDDVAMWIAGKARLTPDALTFAVAPTASIAGGVQIVHHICYHLFLARFVVIRLELRYLILVHIENHFPLPTGYAVIVLLQDSHKCGP